MKPNTRQLRAARRLAERFNVTLEHVLSKIDEINEFTDENRDKFGTKFDFGPHLARILGVSCDTH